ncbi:Membrane protein insertase YidC [Frankliniella fusca]|uniref:Membrane protein insertase YidC n=1 Tax=Frankliniella fusca TaxID=407009 RepID=A0AAE1HJU4_9NEOP|nr:Membrane protein insertase YidC [Frankliniella fusca]
MRVVVILCVALLLLRGLARAALPAVVLEVAEVDEVPNEAAAALALLSPFLDTQDVAVTLVLFGNASWSGDFLSGLPPLTVRTVLPDTDQYWEWARYDPRDNMVIVFAVEGPVDPHDLVVYHMNMKRSLFWFSDNNLFTNISNTGENILCAPHAGVAITAPDGSTALYSVIDCDERANEVVDRWSPSERRWQHGGAISRVFTNFCSGWKPAVPPEPLHVIELSRTKSMNRAVRVFTETRRRTSLLGEPTTTFIKFTSPATLYRGYAIMAHKMNLCRLDGFFSTISIQSTLDHVNVEYLTERKMYRVDVLVPAGLGRVVSPLSAVALEFSPAVWYGTALAALGTAAALACTLRRDRGDALLLALAPLLAQAPPPPPRPPGPALRSLLGAWLLVCVVLAAAYQGLLLGMLSSARPRGEIDSLEALADSGLKVFFSWHVSNLADNRGYDNFRKLNGTFEWDEVRTLRDMALHRNCALITIEDRMLERLFVTLNIPERRLHYFSVGTSNLKRLAAWSPGSPVGRALAATYDRLDEGGILDRSDDLFAERFCGFCRLHSARSLKKDPVALTLRQMYPAFLVLLVGCSLAALVFAAELVSARGPLRVRARPGPAGVDANIRLMALV